MTINSIVPKDLELVIPGNLGFFEILIVISFLLHILFVNITVGSSVLAVGQEIKGIRKKCVKTDVLAEQLSTHTSVLKSIAVVMGIAPLLLISVMYTQYFYSSTNLIGKAWLSIIVLLIVAFLLLYLYKFSWHKMQGKLKGIHVLIGATGSLILLFIPLIFIVNVVSMLYPEMWRGAEGFFHSLVYYPQVWPRYFHFILASFAATGIYLYFWNGRLQKNGTIDESDAATYQSGKRLGIVTTIWTTVLQLVVGFVLLMSFNRDIMLLYLGDDFLLTSMLIGSIVLTLVLVFFLYRLLKTDQRKFFVSSITTFFLILALMGWMRHELRESYLSPYLEEQPRTTQAQSK